MNKVITNLLSFQFLEDMSKVITAIGENAPIAHSEIINMF